MMTIAVFLVAFSHKMCNKRLFRRRNLIDKVSNNFDRQSKCRQSTICRRIRRHCRNESLRLSLGQTTFWNLKINFKCKNDWKNIKHNYLSKQEVGFWSSHIILHSLLTHPPPTTQRKFYFNNTDAPEKKSELGICGEKKNEKFNNF